MRCASCAGWLGTGLGSMTAAKPSKAASTEGGWLGLPSDWSVLQEEVVEIVVDTQQGVDPATQPELQSDDMQLTYDNISYHICSSPVVHEAQIIQEADARVVGAAETQPLEARTVSVPPAASAESSAMQSPPLPPQSWFRLPSSHLQHRDQRQCHQSLHLRHQLSPLFRQPCPRHRHQRQWTVHGTPPAPPWVRSQRNAGLLRLALLCLPTFAQLPGLPRRPHLPRRQSRVSWRRCTLPNLHRLAGRSSRRGGRKRRARRCCKSTRSSRSRSQRLRKPTWPNLLLCRSHCRVQGFTAYRIPRVVAVAGWSWQIGPTIWNTAGVSTRLTPAKSLADSALAATSNSTSPYGRALGHSLLAVPATTAFEELRSAEMSAVEGPPRGYICGACAAVVEAAAAEALVHRPSASRVCEVEESLRAALLGGTRQAAQRPAQLADALRVAG